MSLLAALEGRHDVAARICASAETAHVRHGQVQRRPAGERIRASVLEILDRKLGAGWRARSADGAALPGEEEACAMALGAVSPGR